MSYVPASLPRLPRDRCPATVIYLDKSSIKHRICGQPVVSRGWCKNHLHIQPLLDRLDVIGYPVLQVNEQLRYGGSAAAWEEALLPIPPCGQWLPTFREDEVARFKRLGKLSRYEEIESAILACEQQANVKAARIA